MGDAVYDYGFRIYNPKIAKFLSVDPLMAKYPMLTSYQFASNTPVMAIDLDGLEAVVQTDFKKLSTAQGVLVTYNEKEVSGQVIYTMVVYQKFTKPDGSVSEIVTTLDNDGPTQKEVKEMALLGKATTVPIKYQGPGQGMTNTSAWEGARGSVMYEISLNLKSSMRSLSGKEKFEYDNVFLHFTGQALAAYIYGSEAAKYIGDLHERNENERYIDVISGKAENILNEIVEYSTPDGKKVSKKFDYIIVDQVKDILNNAWGRDFGELLGRFGGKWTNHRTAWFLNKVQEYFEKSWKGMEFKRFKSSDEVVGKITKAINKR